jgi:hypothetical protein
MARQFGSKQKPENAGEVRQSQLITTFGIGSIVDFVCDTVIIGGVDKWDRDDIDEDWEDRKLFNNNLQTLTGAEFFLAPKSASNMRFRKSNDVESYIFPRKLYCPICKHIIDAEELGNQQKKHNCFMPNPKKGGKPCGGHLVASRFVLVCPNGHIEDFPYSWWVHHGNKCSSGKANPRIKMFNIDNRSDVDSLMVECEECQARRGMANAFAKNAFSGENGYPCCGHHPHLGINHHSECAEIVSARLRSSSSVYFPANMSALSIPPWSQRAVQAIEAAYENIQEMEEFGDAAVRKFIRKQVLNKVRDPITFEDLISAYTLVKDKKASSAMHSEADVFAAEYDVLCRGNVTADEYVASKAIVPPAFKSIFESVTIVEKLTVISALIGFTRIQPWNGTIKDNPCLAPLSIEKKKWLPAVKLLGEGIFIKFDAKALDGWSTVVNDRYSQMAHELENSFFTNERFSSEYVAMHTFAHLLIRQLADDCGYSASSLKEKIYSTFHEGTNQTEMHGVLIYLSTSDAEGSLGGLISIGKDPKRLQAVLKNMLQKALWCSGDPLCASSMQQGFNSLNYAACHDCALLPETSCEFRNVLLDRISVIGTADNPDLGLMGNIALELLGGDQQ